MGKEGEFARLCPAALGVRSKAGKKWQEAAWFVLHNERQEGDGYEGLEGGGGGGGISYLHAYVRTKKIVRVYGRRVCEYSRCDENAGDIIAH